MQPQFTGIPRLRIISANLLALLALPFYYTSEKMQ
jgi:hypothetical protein